MVAAGRSPCVIKRVPPRAWMVRSRHGPQSGEVVAEIAAGTAFGAAKCWHAHIPSSKAPASPSRKQIDPPSAAGKNKIA